MTGVARAAFSVALWVGMGLRSARYRRVLLALVLPVLAVPPARAQDFSEYRLKAAFVYNFALFTEWPPEVGDTLNLCVHGQDPFGDDLDELQSKTAGKRRISLQRKAGLDALKDCQIVFVSASAMRGLLRILEVLADRPILTVADSPGATHQGIMLNLSLLQNKVTFEANLQAARKSRLQLSSKLLRLATEVRQ